MTNQKEKIMNMKQNLEYADLTCAFLFEANLTGAYLYGADLRDANLTNLAEGF